MIFNQPGMVLMRPSLRGANDNPGRNDCFLGEVDDVIAAAEYLRGRPDVDSDRIYLGGHSTGATMALLVAASSSAFRAVFAFGPVADPRSYGDVSCVPEGTSEKEARLGSPIEFVHEIRTPTFLIEGEKGNAGPCRGLVEASDDAPLTFLEIPDGDHYDVIAPGSEVVADAILKDTGPTPNLDLTVEAIVRRFAKD
jgi:alpha/beta superfamily hydrolase